MSEWSVRPIALTIVSRSAAGGNDCHSEPPVPPQRGLSCEVAFSTVPSDESWVRLLVEFASKLAGHQDLACLGGCPLTVENLANEIRDR
jgi:hypothetical protein